MGLIVTFVNGFQAFLTYVTEISTLDAAGVLDQPHVLPQTTVRVTILLPRPLSPFKGAKRIKHCHSSNSRSNNNWLIFIFASFFPQGRCLIIGTRLAMENIFTILNFSHPFRVDFSHEFLSNFTLFLFS